MKIIVCIGFLLLCLTASTLHAQWESLPGPYGCTSVWGFYAEDSTIYASTTIGVYKSSDGGHIWSLLPLELPNNIFYLKLLYKRDKFFFIELEVTDSSNDHFLFFSKDGGKSFDKLFDSSYSYSVTELNNTFFIGRLTDYHCKNDLRTLLSSSDQGKTWNDKTPMNLGNFRYMKTVGNSLYSICSRSRYNFEWQFARSNDNGMTWDSLFGFNTKNTNLLPDVTMFTPFIDAKADTNILIAFDSISQFGGRRRIQHLEKLSLKNNSATNFKFSSGSQFDTTILDMFLYHKTLFAVAQNQVYQYNPFPDRWSVLTDKITRSLSNDVIHQFFPVSKNSNEFLITFSNQLHTDSLSNGIYRCLPGSNLCNISDTGITNTSTNWFFPYHDTLYTHTSAPGSSLFISTDHGETWKTYSVPFSKSNGADISAMGSTPKGLLYSCNDTLYLKESETKIIANFIGNSGQAFLQMGNSHFCQAGSQFFRSDDSGVSWIKLTNITLMYGTGAPGAIFKNLLFYGSDSIVISSDSGKSWNIAKGFPLFCGTLASDNSNIYVEGFNEFGVSYNETFRSSDGGTTWASILPKSNERFSTISPLRNKIFLCGRNGVFRCNPDGSEFVSLFRTQQLRSSYKMESDSEYFYVTSASGNMGNGLYRAKLSDVLDYVDGVSQPIHIEDISLRAYPNPSDGSFTITSTSGIMSITITDELGKELWKNERVSGMHTIHIDGKNLPHGTLYARITTNLGEIKSIKLIHQ